MNSPLFSLVTSLDITMLPSPIGQHSNSNNHLSPLLSMVSLDNHQLRFIIPMVEIKARVVVVGAKEKMAKGNSGVKKTRLATSTNWVSSTTRDRFPTNPIIM
ncbi:hypothetical protein CRG98_012826 [Punica granatum]|uniref:Uncharacterized protein n=1 Tax=Punica granatum TaxID=22663 RepID=A0A2I0KEX2_PUNGR|nr:hypothetical protein CRG98_012826 [Punica granatum]